MNKENADLARHYFQIIAILWETLEGEFYAVFVIYTFKFCSLDNYTVYLRNN